MPVKIRLARAGKRHNPVFWINAANSFNKRDGRYLERLGRYDARPCEDGAKRVVLNFERIKYWLTVGAQPTEIVARLLGKV